MVYCGKPSRACQMCKTRRIKCDEAKPTCLQCQKSRRQCPGYKDDFDLVFRNETQATERRARKAVNSKKTSTQVNFTNQQSTYSSDDGTRDSNGSHSLITPTSDSGMPTLAPMEMPSIPVDQQAPCYFVSHYVITPTDETRGYFDFLMPMLKTEHQDSPFYLAFSAVALASLGNRPNTRASSLFHQAVGHYTKALKAVNLALQNPAQQKTDQTLGAILMLGFFETVAYHKTNALAWGSHIEGAVQLVKMRGKKQLRTKIGHSLFVCVRTQMVIHCMSASKSPQLGSEWWIAEAAKDEAGVFTTRLNLRVAELRAEINTALATFPRTPEYFQKILNFMRRAQAMEQEYLAWEDSLSDNWRPHTVAWVDQAPSGDISKAEVHPGKVDMFNSVWIANIWNQSRVSRLFISGAIVRCAAWICTPVDYRTTPEYAQAVRLCVDLTTDIIASIPYKLGWRVGEGGALKKADYSGFADGSADGINSPRAIGGFFCLWPLFSLCNTDFVSDSQRNWAKGRLIFIAETFGLNQAKILSTFQLRLPSMIILRDRMVHTGPSAAMMAAAAARGYPAPVSTSTSTSVSSPTNFVTNPNPPMTTATINAIAAQNGTTPMPSGPVYTLNPLQQREAMQREAWEKERKQLLKKASNSQGDSVERLLANYLAV